MTILTTQTCDGCQSSRTLNDYQHINAETAGWREVTYGKHLCPACISLALKGKS